MMKITATAATPYSAVELTPPPPVVVVVVVVTVPEPDMVTVVADPVMVVVIICPLAPVTVVVVVCPGRVVVVTEVVVVVLVVVTVVVVGVAVGTFCSVRAMMSPGVVPGHVDTASGLHAPTGRMTYSCPLTDAPIDSPCAIGAPM